MTRKGPTILLTMGERKALQSIVRKSSPEQRTVLRAEIALLASQGLRNDKIMKQLEVSKRVVSQEPRFLALLKVLNSPLCPPLLPS